MLLRLAARAPSAARRAATQAQARVRAVLGSASDALQTTARRASAAQGCMVAPPMPALASALAVTRCAPRTVASVFCARGHATAAAAASAPAAAAGAQSAARSQTKPPFEKILIANRGEIACRIIGTARRMGIKTVAIYSEPDVHSKHVMLADEAVCVGPAVSSESYLNMENVLAACKKTGVQAVHPGYGFLSENTKFAKLLEDNGIKFMGPGAAAIHAMGEKIEAKKHAVEAGVSMVPGYVGAIRDDTHLLEVANQIGYPVMIKASRGGGGKGMRIAWNDKEAKDGFRLSKEEARKSFGDDTMFVEKYIEEPHHIEIQLLLDTHGNGVYLNERECSIQRRNQKVIEEAPSPFLRTRPDVRKKMGEQALSLAKAVGYVSAGTCEFLVDKHHNFYFLEMNTRLQVEHPITEYITQVDVVEEMIRIAAGQPLSITQKQIDERLPKSGWAIETRVYAEDPYRGFLPSIGRLKRYIEPPYFEEDQCDVRPGKKVDVRCDSGVMEGWEITTHYDPLICKLIVHGGSRDVAIEKMRKSLDSYVIRGLNHNVPFLRALLDTKDYKDGMTTTAFIPQNYPKGFLGRILEQGEKDAVLASSLVIHAAHLNRLASINDGQLPSYSRKEAINGTLGELKLMWEKEEYVAKLEHYVAKTAHDTHDARAERIWQFSITKVDSNEVHHVTVASSYVHGDFLCRTRVSFGKDAQPMELTVQLLEVKPFKYTIQAFGCPYSIGVYTPRQEQLMRLMPVEHSLDLSKVLQSPMPGAVVSIAVKKGDKVIPGQEVCVVEAMKMQNALRAEREGIVKNVRVKSGDTVSADDILVEFE